MLKRFLLVLTLACSLCSSAALAEEREPDWQPLDISANFTIAVDQNNIDAYNEGRSIHFTCKKVYDPADVSRMNKSIAYAIYRVSYQPESNKYWIILIKYYQEDDTTHTADLIASPEWQEVEAGSVEEKVCKMAWDAYKTRQDVQNGHPASTEE